MPAIVTNRFIIHAFLIAALLTGAISPACKFIRGEVKSVIEICTLYGLKKIEWRAPGPVPQKDEQHKAASDCAFCFAFAKIKFLGAKIPDATAPTHDYRVSEPAARPEIIKLYALRPLPPRGPPILS
ncbi:MAG: hypothetical protein HY370_03015 [Proteobacteria bacterium]|nr:hypothetical protein [Pseudomonadota bacterium]